LNEQGASRYIYNKIMKVLLYVHDQSHEDYLHPVEVVKGCESFWLEDEQGHLAKGGAASVHGMLKHFLFVAGSCTRTGSNSDHPVKRMSVVDATNV
jgi:hypothetical protein